MARPRESRADDESNEEFNPLANLEKTFQEEDKMKFRIKRRNMRRRSKLKFYKTMYGFNAPLRLLVDESFMRHVIAKQAHRMHHAKHVIGRFIGEEFHLFATRCTIAHWSKKLGNIASLVESVRCDHGKKKTSRGKCLKMKLENNVNGGKFILATCEKKTVTDFKRTTALPIVWANQEKWSLLGAKDKEKQDQYKLVHALCGCNGSEECQMEACTYARDNGLAV